MLPGPSSRAFFPASALSILEPTQAPWIRPGVVVHEPAAPVDELLAAFAGEIAARGFLVAGFVERSRDDCTEVVDLAKGVITATAMEAAARSLRGAMRDDADLVVISRFAALAQAAHDVDAAVADGMSAGMPVLTAIAGQHVRSWLDFAGPGGAMLSPDLEALWRWWGPERLYRDLALGVADDSVRRIVGGPRWLMVEGPAGAGLAYLPAGGKDGGNRLPVFRQMSLRQLAGLSRSWDPLEMAVGIAAINAHYNRFDLEAAQGNGAPAFGNETGRVVGIGDFPGLTEVLSNPQIIETSPRPGEYPTIAMDTLLPGCGAALVSSSALINRTLPRILRLAQGARIGLIGAATPLTPRLYSYGVDVLGGMVVHDPDGLAAAVEAGAQPRDFGRFGHYVHLRCEIGRTRPGRRPS